MGSSLLVGILDDTPSLEGTHHCTPSGEVESQSHDGLESGLKEGALRLSGLCGGAMFLIVVDDLLTHL